MISTFAKQSLLRVRRELPEYRVLRFLPWLALSISLLVTWQLWRSAQNETGLILQAEFNFSVRETSLRIEQQMQAYEELLRGVQGLFAVSGSVGRSEFRDYVSVLDIDKNYPGIEGLGFSLLLPADQKNKHVAAVRREGFPGYNIRPSGVREAYAPLLYLEPFSGRNLQAFGFDNFADPLRRSVMERVRDTGLCIISPKIILAQEAGEPLQPGFLMWLPVYKKGMPHGSLAERRAGFVGWISASFRMNDLMASLFGGNDPRLHIEIYDGEAISEQALMHDADQLFHMPRNAEPLFRDTKRLHIAGHKWTAVFASLPEFDRRLSEQKPRLLAYAGITISILLALITGMLVYGRNRALQSAQMLNRELAERKRAEVGMRLAEKVFDIVDAGVLVTDKGTRIIKVNPAFTAITGYTAEDAIGKTPRILSSGAHTREFYSEMWNSINTTGNWQGEIFNRRKNGEFFTEWLSINEVRDSDGNVTNYVSLFSDISERKAAEAQMHNLAHYDPLTGLPNRILLADRLQQAIAAARREKSHMALMFIDLDKFKPINDTLGHYIGDLMLKEVAKRMLECLRESDTAARIGGDEFVVLLPLIEAEPDALAVAEKIRQALYLPFEIAGHDLNISSSIGIAVYPEHGLDEKSLLHNADIAMYYAKAAGRNCVMIFESGMYRAVQ